MLMKYTLLTYKTCKIILLELSYPKLQLNKFHKISMVSVVWAVG